MYPYYNTGRVYTNSNTAGASTSFPIFLNQNNKGIMVIPDQTSAAGGADCTVKMMGVDGMEAPGHPAGVLLDGSNGDEPYFIPATVFAIVAQVASDAQVVELF